MSSIKQIGFLKRIPKHKTVAIYGAGGCGDFVYQLLKDIGIDVECYVVSDGYKNENQLNGIPIHELSKLPHKGNDCVIILSIMNSNCGEILNNIKKAGYEEVYIFGVKELSQVFKEKLEDWFINNNIDINKETIKIDEWEIKNLFCSDNGLSFAFFSEVGDCVLPTVMGDYSRLNEGAYEYDEIKLECGDVVFDCGANIGLFSSVAALKGCQVYAFEPLENIIEILKQVCFKYIDFIKICPYVLCDYVGKVSFEANPDNASNCIAKENTANNLIELDAITIDSFVEKNNIKKIDFIKADIEGAERLMLKGAKNTLATLAPKLAICTYHLDDDPKVIESLIKEANPNYIVKHKWKKLFAYVPK